MSGGRVWLRMASVACAAAILPLLVLGCKDKDKNTEWPEGKTKVVVSFAPLYCFTVNVAGDDAAVKNVMSTTGPHDFQPTDDDIKLLTKADIFFTLGLGLDENPAQKMKSGSGNSNLKVVELGEMLPKNKLQEGVCNHADHGQPGHTDPTDPHVWLSPEHAVLLTNLIRDELKKADPNHAAGYDARAAAYVAKLNALQAYGVEKLKGKQDRRLVSFHDSLGYFAKSFGLEVKGVLTPKAGQEPNDEQMKQLIAICSKKDAPVRVIAVEPQYSTSNAGEQLRKNLHGKVDGVKLVEIDPLETVRPDELNADWYERKMRANIDNLAKALP